MKKAGIFGRELKMKATDTPLQKTYWELRQQSERNRGQRAQNRPKVKGYLPADLELVYGIYITSGTKSISKKELFKELNFEEKTNFLSPYSWSIFEFRDRLNRAITRGVTKRIITSNYHTRDIHEELKLTKRGMLLVNNIKAKIK
jgi:hypothetical protein